METINDDPKQDLSLKGQQVTAYAAILEYLNDPKATRFVVQGYAGTGKTYLMKKLCQDLGGNVENYIFTAPTNKATKILAKMLKPWLANCRTIYSALQIYLKGEETEPKLVFPDFPPRLDYGAIVIDEASMLTSELLDYMDENYPLTKLIFIGDPAQLPPVGEAESPVWSLDCKQVRLTDVLRHDNQILTFATHIRACIEDETEQTRLKMKPDNDGKFGVFRLRRPKFIQRVERMARLDKFRVVDHTKVVAWRNKAVDYYNGIIREIMFGGSSKDEWLPDDWVMMAEPIMEGKTPIATIDEEGVIVSRDIMDHPRYPQYKCYALHIELSTGTELDVMVIHEDSQKKLNNDLNDIAELARQPGNHKMWSKFWELREAFHRIRYAYAITAHRAQGSTYVNVLIDATDILYNKDVSEALRCLYVAVTRASTRVVLG